MVEKPSLLGHGVGPLQCPEMEAQSWVPQQRRTVGHTDGEIGRRGERLDKAYGAKKPRKEDVVRSLLESVNQAVEKKVEPNETRPTKKPRDLPHLELDIPEAGQRPTLEIRGDCKTTVDWINNGHAKMKTRECTVEKTQNLLA